MPYLIYNCQITVVHVELDIIMLLHTYMYVHVILNGKVWMC